MYVSWQVVLVVLLQGEHKVEKVLAMSVDFEKVLAMGTDVIT